LSGDLVILCQRVRPPPGGREHDRGASGWFHRCDHHPDAATLDRLAGGAAEALFGPARPAPAAVEAAEEKALNHVRERWTGHHVTAYDGDEPTALFFFGVSGD
jgi:hypothetical protein